MHQRYAIYFTPPPGPLADFGAAWLGWDIASGTPCAQPDVPDLPRPIGQITRTPRKYGFHATLKPPFHLASGRDPDALRCRLDALAGTLAPVSCGGLGISRIGPFLALTPISGNTALRDLAATLVQALDPFRAPADDAELARRRAHGLSPVQEANLVAWGYPHVMGEFRFHMTLTGKLRPGEAEVVEAALTRIAAPLLVEPFTVDSITLAGERADGRFESVASSPLAAPVKGPKHVRPATAMTGR